MVEHIQTKVWLPILSVELDGRGGNILFLVRPCTSVPLALADTGRLCRPS